MAQQANLNTLTPSVDQEGRTLVVNEKTGLVEYSREEPVSERQIAQIGFNRKDGTLNFVRNNGELVIISGFLTGSQLGRGLQGPRGPRGKNGKDGRIGRDGKEGKQGCEGPVGPKGELGTSGIDGEDGETGIKGLFGCPGPPGQNGLAGAKGLVGFEGPVGIPGPSCIVGPRGEPGPQPNESAWYGEFEPAPEYFVWAVPTENDVTIISPPVEAPDEMSGRVVGITSQLSLLTDNTYEGSLTLNLSQFTGGKGPFTYQWTDNDNAFSSAALSVGNTGTDKTSLRINALQNIDPGNSVEISGTVNLRVTDTGTGDVLNIRDIPFTFQGTNTQDPDPGDGGGGGPIFGGGGGGCVDADAPIEVLNKGTLMMRNLQQGDYVRSIYIDGMVDEDIEGWEQWTTTDATGDLKWVQVRSTFKSTYRQHYLINDLRITTDHHLLVKREGTWAWILSQDVQVGDMLLTQEGEQEVTVFELVQEPLETIVLNVEPYDCYFAGTVPVLIHNSNEDSLVKKN